MVATERGRTVRRSGSSASEDPRFITGAGHYVETSSCQGCSTRRCLRSPYAHATDQQHRHDAAPRRCRASSPCYTGKDIELLPALPCAWPAAGVDE